MKRLIWISKLLACAAGGAVFGAFLLCGIAFIAYGNRDGNQVAEFLGRFYPVAGVIGAVLGLVVFLLDSKKRSESSTQ